MDDVRPYNHSVAFAPVLVMAANGDRLVEGNDDLDGVMRVRRHDALSLAEQQESPIPQVPAWHV